MGSIRCLASKGTLFMDFRFGGERLREYTTLADNTTNRKRLQKALDRIESEIALGTFDYAKTFGKPLSATEADEVRAPNGKPLSVQAGGGQGTPTLKEFAEQWYSESEITWRRSYRITQRGALDKYILPTFGDKPVSSISKTDVLAFRVNLTKLPGRGDKVTLSGRRINAVMKPLRQILNEAADRYEFNSGFRNIKPMRVKRSDVLPFSLEEVNQILNTARPDFKNYFTVRFFTGMRTGEVHGLKWKYIDFERRLILVRESIVLGEEDELKTDGSTRDIQMSQIVLDAFQAQYQVTGGKSDYVFCNQAGKPIDNKNFVNRVWSPLLRHLGLTHRKAYQMRHTAATLWLAAGEAPEWIARQLGHTSTEMLFRVYSRFIPNLTRNDGSAMDRLLTHTFATGGAQAPVSSPLQNLAQHQLPGMTACRVQTPHPASPVPSTPTSQGEVSQPAQPPPVVG